MKHCHVKADSIITEQDNLKKSVAQIHPCTNAQTNHRQRRPTFTFSWRNVLISPATWCRYC